ncbi:MAG: RteC domain-containing protein [Brumimicrobium sp.]
MKSINHIVGQLDSDLKELGYTDLNTSSNNLKALELLKTALNNLKNTVLKSGFPSLKEEIRFFKEVKPYLLSRFLLISFVIQYNDQKYISNEAADNLLQSKAEEHNTFLREYKTYLLQLKSVTTEQEKVFFVRNQFSPPLCDVLKKVFLNPEFCTFHSELLTMFKSQRLIQKFLDSEKDRVSNKNTTIYKLKWTQKKTALIELMYGLHYSNSLNNGQSNISEIKEVFETVFNVDLGNVYRIFHDIKNRERRTPFIDSLRVAVENKLDEEDAFKP